MEKTSTYKGTTYKWVETPTNECTGCMFEHSVFGGDCLAVHKKPECNGFARKDGRNLIFVEVRKKKNRK